MNSFIPFCQHGIENREQQTRHIVHPSVWRSACVTLISMEINLGLGQGSNP